MALTPTLPASNQQTLPKAIAAAPISIPATPTHRFSFPQWLELWHLTSLDAPTVAVTWCLSFAFAAQIHLPWWLPLILGLSTWSLYITDRLLDSRAASKHHARTASPRTTPASPYSLIPSPCTSVPSPRTTPTSPYSLVPSPCTSVPSPCTSVPSPRTTPASPYSLVPSPCISIPSPCTSGPSPCTLQPRHHFHWQHRHLFLPAAIASAITALALVVHYMPRAAQTRNSILALASLAYLTSVHARPTLRIPKELLVAIVFTAACTFPVLLRIETLTPAAWFTLLPAILLFTALGWLNCQAIEFWESNRTSRIIPKASIALSITAAILATITAIDHHPRPALLMASAGASAMLLALLDKLKPNLTPTTLRTAADLALLTPLTLLAWQAMSP